MKEGARNVSIRQRVRYPDGSKGVITGFSELNPYQFYAAPIMKTVFNPTIYPNQSGTEDLSTVRILRRKWSWKRMQSGIRRGHQEYGGMSRLEAEREAQLDVADLKHIKKRRIQYPPPNALWHY